MVKRLNDCNYSVKNGRSKPAVVHVDRMHKLPVPPEAETAESSLPTIAEGQLSEPVNENNTAGTNTHCADSSSHADSVDRHEPIVHDNPGADNVCPGGNPGNRRGKKSPSRGSDTATAAESAATSSEPRPASTTRPARVHLSLIHISEPTRPY